MNVYALGASKNIGYFAALRLLEKGASVTFLVRSPASLETNEVVKPYIESGKAKLVKGDALSYEDVAKGWEESLALGSGTIDVVIFTVGGYPVWRWTKGLVLEPADLVTRAFLNLLRSLPASLRSPTTQPKLITITSAGLTHSGRRKLPFILRPIYWLIASPHEDKIATEAIAAHYTGRSFPDKVRTDLLPTNWTSQEGVMEKGSYKGIVVLRPSLYTDGECLGDKVVEGKKPYRVEEEDITGYTISRKDVAHFVAGDLLKDWEKWEGKCVGVSY